MRPHGQPGTQVPGSGRPARLTDGNADPGTRVPGWTFAEKGSPPNPPCILNGEKLALRT